jgi:hypothetical protein
MGRRGWYWVAKGLEGVGLVVVLVGVFFSISYGLEDKGLSSMAVEMRALLGGGALFVAGVAIERAIGSR